VFSINFGSASNDLCSAISDLAHHISPLISTLDIYTASLLGKRPGVRPISVDIVLRRILEKTVMKIVR